MHKAKEISLKTTREWRILRLTARTMAVAAFAAADWLLVETGAALSLLPGFRAISAALRFFLAALRFTALTMAADGFASPSVVGDWHALDSTARCS
jgi:hypothetical protein